MWVSLSHQQQETGKVKYSKERKHTSKEEYPPGQDFFSSNVTLSSKIFTLDDLQKPRYFVIVQEV